MADEVFKIEIISTADTAGFTHAAAGAGELTKAQAGVVEVTHEGGRASEKAAEKIEGETLSRREQGKVLMEVGNAAGFAGHSLRELAYGPVGAALALVGVYEELKAKVEEVEKAADKLDEEELAEHQQSIKNLEAQWDDAHAALGKYFAALNNSGGGDDPIKKQMESVKALADAKIDASKRIQEELGREELAHLRATGASPEAIQAAEQRQRAAVDRLGAEKKNADGPAADEEELRRRKAADQGESEAAQRAIWAAATAKGKETKTKQELDAADAVLDPTTEKGKDLAKRKEQADADLARTTASREEAKRSGEYTTLDDRLVDEAQGKADEMNAEIARAKKAQQAAAAAHAQAQAEADDAEEKSKNAQKVSTENRDRITELPGKIQSERAVQAVDDHTQKVIDTLNLHGGKTNQALGDLATAVGLTEQQKLNIVTRILNHTLSTKEAWAGLDQRLALIEARQQNGNFNRQ